MSLIYGFGVNDADYRVTSTIDGKRVVCPYYRAWTGMLGRCFSVSSLKKYPSYAGCTVADEWRSFLAFKAWMEAQDWQGKHLDKDIIIPENKVYSLDTCVFVSGAINTLLVDCKASTGKFPKGVCFDKSEGKFIARMRVFGKSKRLGLFDCPEEAGNAYREAKRLHILRVASTEPDVRVKQGLYRHSQLYKRTG
jgi:hypothetical protein